MLICLAPAENFTKCGAKVLSCKLQKKSSRYNRKLLSDLAGNRTRAFAVRGRRLSRLTTRPYRGDKIRTCGLCVPNAALYQTEPHLELCLSWTQAIFYTMSGQKSTSIFNFLKFFSELSQVSSRSHVSFSKCCHTAMRTASLHACTSSRLAACLCPCTARLAAARIARSKTELFAAWTGLRECI